MRRTTAPIFVLSVILGMCSASAMGQSGDATNAHRLQFRPAPTVVHGPPVETRKAMVAAAAASGSSPLPIWNYEVISSRDGNLYEGVIVGANPNTRGPDANVKIPAQLVPIVLKFQTVATSFDPNTGILSTEKGSGKTDPTVADTGCFTGAANVPLKVMEQSPILKNADFNFGGTDVDTTEYNDAFQRANFWSLIDRSNYHVRLAPVDVLPPIVVTVPAKQGLVIPANLLAPGVPACGPEGLVTFGFFDGLVVNALSKLPGVSPGTLPMFMLYNTGIALGDPTNLGNCCAGGYHSIVPVNSITFQPYAAFDFEVSGLFESVFNNTSDVSHEVGEWMNDPYLINATPPWGHVGQVGGCQANLEVGDPLSGTLAPRIAMPNGYTYNLQELAFFSWFYGAPSLGIHHWFSNNDTFSTDAGPVCQ
jgi:hypothetical protein